MPLSKRAGNYGNAEQNHRQPFAPGQSEAVRALPKGTADRLIADSGNRVVMSDVDDTPREITPGQGVTITIIAVLAFGCLILSNVGSVKFANASPAPATQSTSAPELIAEQVSPVALVDYPTITPQPTATPLPTVDGIYLERLKQEQLGTAATANAIQLTQAQEYLDSVNARANETTTAEVAATERAARQTFLLAQAAGERQAVATERAIKLANEQRSADLAIIGQGVLFGLGAIVALLAIWILCLKVTQMLQERRIDQMATKVPEIDFLRNVPTTLAPSSGIVESDYKDDFEGTGIQRGEAYWFFKHSPAEALLPQHGQSGRRRDIAATMTEWCVIKGFAIPAAGNAGARWKAGFSNGSVARAHGLALNGNPN